MLCEKAYYPNSTGENREHIYCSDERAKEFFNGECPFVYLCTVSEKFENTTGMFNCKFRKGKS